MKKSIVMTLCILPLALAPAAYGQGPERPSGSGAMSADKQAKSTSPDALSGNVGTNRANGNAKKPAAPAPSTPTQPRSPSHPAGVNGTASNRSSSGDSTGTSANQAPSLTGKAASSGKSTTPSSK